MGVPKFYRWLSERYPCINEVVNSHTSPQFDNLYLDMNGIIHNSTYGESSEGTIIEGHAVLSEEQMFTSIFKYIDKLVKIAKPQKLLYMALDGVAPRAKMNQQRQRRFRSAMDRLEAARQAAENGVLSHNSQQSSGVSFDSNCITPGTEFMSKLSANLIYFVRRKMKEDLNWKRMRVIFSGSEVPGEGEHKIMLYIRNMKMQPTYEPNLRHLIYGLDADLIMLALVTHEPHFALLREEVIFGQQQSKAPRKVLKKFDEFQFLHIGLLREYLNLEYNYLASQLSFQYDVERIIDDWMFLAILVGNDFLPHLPTLDIAEGGLDQLYEIYKRLLPATLGGYITHQGSIDVNRLELILAELGKIEDDVFTKRLEESAKEDRKHKREKVGVQEIDPEDWWSDEDKDTEIDRNDVALPIKPKHAKDETADNHSAHKRKYYQEKFPEFYGLQSAIEVSQANLRAAAAVSSALDDEQKDSDRHTHSNSRADPSHVLKHPGAMSPSPMSPSAESSDDEGELPPMPLPSNFDPNMTPAQHRRALVANFLEGLEWTLKYYYAGCVSWKWYFGYRYAPLASDMVDLASIPLAMPLGIPFRPLEQLLGVLPPQSGQLLPKEYRNLMTNNNSPIQSFYPHQFEVDMNGKKSSWEGIALIPFIDEVLLLKAVQQIPVKDGGLTTSELKRNIRFGDELQFDYDENNHDTVRAEYLPTMPILNDANTTVTKFILPPIPWDGRNGKSYPTANNVEVTNSKDDHEQQKAIVYNPALNGLFRGLPCPGAIIPSPGYPSFITLRVMQTKLDIVPVNVFGSESRKQSLVVSVYSPPQQADNNNKTAYSALCGKRVYCNYPYQRPAIITAVVDGTSRFTGNNAVTALSSNEQIDYQKTVETLQSALMHSKAVDVGQIELLVYVRMFVGMKQLPDGSVMQQFDTAAETAVPYQLIAETVRNPDKRHAERPPQTVKDLYPVGSPVIFTGPKHYGSSGEVTAVHNDTQTIDIRLHVVPPEPAFGHKIAKESRLQYYPAYMVSKHLNIHPAALSKLTGVFPVKLHFPPPSSNKWDRGETDIGLKLKMAARSLVVNDYARLVANSWDNSSAQYMNKNGGGDEKKSAAPGDTNQIASAQWEYSEKAIALVAAYHRRFPSLFEAIVKNPNERFYSASQLIESIDEYKKLDQRALRQRADQFVAEVAAWLNSLGINSLILIPSSSQVVSDRGVKQIEQESARIARRIAQMKLPTITLTNLPLYHVYQPTPAVAWSPTSSVPVELGDRVMSVRSDDGVLQGLRGTVVAIHRHERLNQVVEVVFDEQFLSGTTLQGKCSNLRGQTLPLTSIINLSKPVILSPQSIAADVAAHGDAQRKVHDSVAVKQAATKIADEEQRQADRRAGKFNNKNGNGKQRNDQPRASAPPMPSTESPAKKSKHDRKEKDRSSGQQYAAKNGQQQQTSSKEPPKVVWKAPTEQKQEPAQPTAPVKSQQPKTIMQRPAQQQPSTSSQPSIDPAEVAAYWSQLQQQQFAGQSQPQASAPQQQQQPASSAGVADMLKSLLRVGSNSSAAQQQQQVSPPQQQQQQPQPTADDPIARRLAKAKARQAALQQQQHMQ